MNLRLLRLEGVPIWHQLAMEEALLRAAKGNWAILNYGSPAAVILGVSGRLEEWVNCAEVTRQGIPVYKRFSGGGTVVVDETTLFVTLIGEREALPFPVFPEPLMRWSADLYRTAIDHPDFSLRENDYIIGERKCGGNAQYLRKQRWLHHTSFLWDYCSERMRCLPMPPRMPGYRERRSHNDFLLRLKEHYPSPALLQDRFEAALTNHFTLERVAESEIAPILARPHRKATTRLL